MDNEPIDRITMALPAYNEAEGITPLLEKAEIVFEGLKSHGTIKEWSVVVVDDGSADATAERVREFSEYQPQVRLVQHPQNRGLGPAIMTGIKTAIEIDSGPTHMVIGMDADNTHPPETIPMMIERANAGSDIVIASRYQQGSEQHGVPPFRLLMSVGARWLFRVFLAIPGVRDYTCGFRAIRASLLADAVERFGEDGLITRSGFACTDELLVHLATLHPTIEEVPFILRYDLKEGASKINLSNTIVETLKLLMSHRKELKDYKSKK